MGIWGNFHRNRRAIKLMSSKMVRTHTRPGCFISLSPWLWMGRFAICLNNNFLFSMNWASVSRTIKASFPPHLSWWKLILQDHCATTALASTASYNFSTFPPNEVRLPGQNAGCTGIDAHSKKNRKQIRNSSSIPPSWQYQNDGYDFLWNLKISYF